MRLAFRIISEVCFYYTLVDLTDKSQPNYDNQYLPDDTSGVGYKSEDFDEPEVPSERYEGYEKGIQQNESEPVQLEDKEGQKSVAVSDATITNVKTKTEESGQIVSEEAQKETETQISTTKGRYCFFFFF